MALKSCAIKLHKLTKYEFPPPPPTAPNLLKNLRSTAHASDSMLCDGQCSSRVLNNGKAQVHAERPSMKEVHIYHVHSHDPLARAQQGD